MKTLWQSFLLFVLKPFKRFSFALRTMGRIEEGRRLKTVRENFKRNKQETSFTMPVKPPKAPQLTPEERYKQARLMRHKLRRMKIKHFGTFSPVKPLARTQSVGKAER